MLKTLCFISYIYNTYVLLVIFQSTYYHINQIFMTYKLITFLIIIFDTFKKKYLQLSKYIKIGNLLKLTNDNTCTIVYKSV